jgi:Tfp pilus assembly protein PilV
MVGGRVAGLKKRRGAIRKVASRTSKLANGEPKLERGSLLLEAMIALVILAIGALGATAGHIIAIKNSSSSRHQSIAMSLAEEQLEIMRIASATDVKAMTAAPGYPNDPTNPIDPDTSDSTSMAFNRSWTISPDTPEPGVIAITVQVNWVNPLGNDRTVRLQTLKADF